MKLLVHTAFGCICFGKMECRVCAGSGRRYELDVDNTKKVQAIWDALCAQNELLNDLTPILQHERELLDLDRRIISYDILENSEIKITLPPTACCQKPNRKQPPSQATPVRPPSPPAQEAEEPAPPANSGDDEEEGSSQRTAAAAPGV